jgi:SMC interacting uncharacterized protein involved in chromosome segregation
MRNMKWLCAIPLLTLLFALPAYAEDNGMDVEVNISGGSDVEVNTGDNSEVDVNTGANNNVYINGQDINQPTVIKKTIKQGYAGALLSQRIAKLEYWRSETLPVVNLLSDGIAKLITEYESGQVTDEEFDSKLIELEAMLASYESKLAELDSNFNSEKEANSAVMNGLQFQIDLLNWQVKQDKQTSTWLIIILSAGLAIVGGLMMYRTRR